MSLWEQAEADLATGLEDPSGFSRPITVTNPEGLRVSMRGIAAHIGHSIDPETLQAVSGRRASVSLRISTLKANGLELPANIPDNDRKPWVISFPDAGGTLHTFKVCETRPDDLGIVTCLLEAYDPDP